MMIMTDQDVDGFHIRGLIINFIQTNWPELISMGFISGFTTPLIKLIANNSSSKKKALKISPDLDGELWFFSEIQFNKFIETNPEYDVGFKKKYFKGLGTSNTTDGVKYFKRLDERQATYVEKNPDDTAELMDMAFNKKRADDRKDWLKTTTDMNGLDYSQTKVQIKDFINKELKVFSISDNIRSIPSVLDGFKPSQREILYVCMKILKTSNSDLKSKGLKEMKVAQLGAQVATLVDYDHAEASLFGTIINMAQKFVGAGNHQCILGNGQFGSRMQNGKDSAAPRYIYTSYNPMDEMIHRPDDLAIMNYILNEDGQRLEPIELLPIIPTILAYGASGIGTGYSTDIPCYNPRDLITGVRQCMDNVTPTNFKPWYNNFKGRIIRDSSKKNTYITIGVFELSKDSKKFYVRIKELPIGTSVMGYLDYLQNVLSTIKCEI
jgi:DNA topoisomerase-2